MGSMSIKIKLMPSSVETDLKKIEEKAKKTLEENQAKNIYFEEEPIAFGLKAINIFFIWPEEKELEWIEQKLSEIENVSSEELVDMRKTIG